MARKFTNKQFEKLEKRLREYPFKKSMNVLDELTLNEYYGIKGLDYDKIFVNPTNKFNSETENQMLSKEEIENRLKDNTEFVKQIDRALSILKPDDRKIIEDYYIYDLGWIMIQRNMNYCIRRCQRKRDLAMIRMWEYLHNEKIDKKTGNTQLTLDGIK